MEAWVEHQRGLLALEFEEEQALARSDLDHASARALERRGVGARLT